MRYENTKTGRFIDRPNRFIAHVEIGGSIETVHVKNTGRCKELLLPGAKVTLANSDNPSRKTKYDLVSVYKKSLGWVNIASQKANGWICLPDHYDDGGFSGGNTNRPALKQLLLDCEAGKVDIIVCYKVDRLSRSLCDFTELSKQFAKWGVAFVSVTQQIDTSTSGGKMMLNMLMIFAEYEREIIGERIRDKMRATRKKGLWAGGCVAIGYNLVDHHLIPNPDEVPIVQRIFRRYVETQSPKQVAAELNRDGVMTRKGIPWNNTKIYAVLNNYAYIGQINYKGEISQSIHPAIIDIETWDKAHEFLDANSPTKGGRKERREEAHPLKSACSSADTAAGHCRRTAGGRTDASTCTTAVCATPRGPSRPAPSRKWRGRSSRSWCSTS
jgi:site-specific DNA recombinase